MPGTDVERSVEVDAPADRLFDYLSDVSHLPEYFDSMTDAHRTDGDAVAVTAEVPGGGHQEGEAWFRVDDERRRIEWGSEGESDYHGWLEVDDRGDTSQVRVGIHAVHDDVEDGLDRTLGNIKAKVEAG